MPDAAAAHEGKEKGAAGRVPAYDTSMHFHYVNIIRRRAQYGYVRRAACRHECSSSKLCLDSTA